MGISDKTTTSAHKSLIAVILPILGEGVVEATFVKSLKKVGESVKKDEPLFEVSTDKVDTEIPSPADGVVTEIVAREGQPVPVLETVIFLAPSANTPAAVAAAPAVPPPPVKVSAPTSSELSPLPQVPVPSQTPSGGTPVSSQLPSPLSSPLSSPLVRKVAQDRNINLHEIPGSGLGGRIVLKDLDSLPPSPSIALPPSSLTHHSIAPLPPLLTKRGDDGRETLEGVPIRREKMSKMRSLIAEHMVRSVKTSPHVTTVFEMDLHNIATLRERHQETIKKREGFGLSYTAFFAYVAAKTIKKFPIVNVSVDGDQILWKDSINLGIAVAIESGLIVPVIRNAGDLNILGIARQIQQLAQKARNKKLSLEDVQGGTFSITNPGMFGSLVSAPIINQPQVAILSIGAIIKRPVVIAIPTATGFQDTIAIRPLVQIGLTFDHRVIDGEGGARYLAAFKESLEGFSDSEILG